VLPQCPECFYIRTDFDEACDMCAHNKSERKMYEGINKAREMALSHRQEND
jgi:hypothetical protein